MIVCDEKKIIKELVVGAPDFVLEIASPSNSRRDYGVKHKIYMDKGVREYWILDPMKQILVVYNFENDCIPQIHSLDENVPVSICNGGLSLEHKEFKEIINKFG